MCRSAVAGSVWRRSAGLVGEYGKCWCAQRWYTEAVVVCGEVIVYRGVVICVVVVVCVGTVVVVCIGVMACVWLVMTEEHLKIVLAYCHWTVSLIIMW